MVCLECLTSSESGPQAAESSFSSRFAKTDIGLYPGLPASLTECYQCPQQRKPEGMDCSCRSSDLDSIKSHKSFNSNEAR